MVERRLMRDRKITRHDLGREAFVAEVWKWKEQYGNTITSQLRHLGVSVDWTRERFTMDSMLSAGVQEAFVRLYESGLITRCVLGIPDWFRDRAWCSDDGFLLCLS